MNKQPISLDRFIKLVTKQKLDKADVGIWYKCVINHAPSGITHTVTITNQNGEPNSVAMIHRVENNDVHSYIIPISRDLSDNEIEKIVKETVDKLPDFDFNIETHAIALHAKEHGRIKLDATKHLALCNALAKQQHEDWIRERSSSGWRYGVKFDQDEKTHPLILPWDQIPDKFKEPNIDWPQKLITFLDDQGYAVIDKIELQRLLKLLKKN